jgi:hypothetical protein
MASEAKIMTGELHAYYHGDDDGIEFVFAATDAEAERMAHAEITAAPCFDKYAPGPIQDDQLYAEGWRVRCANCEHVISAEDGCYECADEGEEDNPVVDGHGVYCNAECRDAEKARVARVKQKKADATAALAALLPFVTPTHAHVGAPGECKGKCFDQDCENVAVWFAVPGGALSEKTRHGNAYHNAYCHGCGQVWVARGDVERFRELRAAHAALC